ncbi:MAG: hypothetical protein LBP58_05815 [Azoarcus sp.]|jgi:hypothetical protein|nr:hypothetical protein [Azoarcus sp.]
MPTIPYNINGVELEFHADVNRDVKPELIDGLNFLIVPDVVVGYTLRNIYIRSAFDSHALPSRHMMQKGVDLSRFNGVLCVQGYGINPETTAIVQALQTRWEQWGGRRENFGPFFKKKLGQPHAVAGHHDHIHISVN